jgi:hypothetical protein
MKKYLLLFIIAALVCVPFCSCSSVKGWNISDLQKSEYPPVIAVTDAEMKLADINIKPDVENVQATITNLSDKEYGYGREPRLEVKYGEDWYIIPTLENIAWDELWVLLAPGMTNNETLPLAEYYGTLPAGTYRFIKVLSAGDVKLPVASEFIINA